MEDIPLLNSPSSLNQTTDNNSPTNLEIQVISPTSDKDKKDAEKNGGNNDHNNDHQVIQIDGEVPDDLKKRRADFESDMRLMFPKKRKDAELSHSQNAAELSNECLVKFFDLLIPDWQYRKDEKDQKYDLTWKSVLIFEITGSDLVTHTTNLLKNPKKSIFHYVAYSVLFQFIHERIAEIENLNKKESGNKYEHPIIEFQGSGDIASLLRGIDDEYQTTIKIALTHFSKKIGDELDESDKEIQALNFLRNYLFWQFEEKFIELLDAEKEKHGLFHEVVFQPIAQLYYYFAKKMDIQNIVELIFQVCPHVDEGWCLVSNFHKQRDIRIFGEFAKENDADIVKVLELAIHCRVVGKLKKDGFGSEKGKDCVKKFVKSHGHEKDILNLIEKELQNHPVVKSKKEEFLQKFYEIEDVENFLDKELLGGIRKMLNKEIDHREIFGRNLERPKSLFELIISVPEMATSKENLIKFLWEKFGIIKTPEILQIKNSEGKTIVDYVIEGDDPWNLMSLIECDKYHQYFSYKLEEKTGLNLFKYYLKLSISHPDETLLSKFFKDIILHLLEEQSDECLITEIDKISQLSDNETFGLKLDANNPADKKNLLKSKFYKDQLLCVMIGRLESNLYEPDLKKRLHNLKHPIIELIFMIIDNDEDTKEEKKNKKFVENFKSNILEAEMETLKKYGIIENTSRYISKFLQSIFISATIHNKRVMMDKLFEKENVTAMDVNYYIPKTMKVCEGSSYAVLKLLETGSGNILNDADIPKRWLNPKDFEQFLDSRIRKTDDGERIEIDTTFLLHTQTKRFNVKSRNDLIDQLIFCDDTEAFEYVKGNKWLKEYITHPAIASYVSLKWFKYERIYFWNFFFLLMQLIIYSMYAIVRSCDDSENKENLWCLTSPILPNPHLMKYIAYLTLPYMIMRELFQFWKEKIDHFKSIMNIFEIFLIVSIIASFICDNAIFPYLACFNILSMASIMATMFPYSSMYFQMQLFGKIGKTFMKFLLTFMFLLIAFVLVFVIIFDITIIKNIGGEIQTSTDFNETEKANSTDKETEKGPDFFSNFKNFGSAGVKVIMMMSGEFAIEPFELDVYQLLFCLGFVIISYNLFNMMNALAIDETTTLKEAANRLVLKKQIERIVRVNDVFRELYNKEKPATADDSFHINGWLAWIMRFIVSERKFLHKIDKIYINLKTRKYEMLINSKFIHPVTFMCFKPLHVDHKIFEKIIHILKERQDEFKPKIKVKRKKNLLKRLNSALQSFLPTEKIEKNMRSAILGTVEALASPQN